MSYSGLGSREKRNFIRMDINTEVTFKVHGTNEEFKGKCKNLSHTGLQFSTLKTLKEGSELDVTIHAAAGVVPQRPLKAVLSVKRVIKNTDNEYLVSGDLRDVK